MQLSPNILKAAVAVFVFGVGLLLLTYLAEFFIPVLLLAAIAGIAWYILTHHG